jgi:hypothetical protein
MFNQQIQEIRNLKFSISEGDTRPGWHYRRRGLSSEGGRLKTTTRSTTATELPSTAQHFASPTRVPPSSASRPIHPAPATPEIRRGGPPPPSHVLIRPNCGRNTTRTPASRQQIMGGLFRVIVVLARGGFGHESFSVSSAILCDKKAHTCFFRHSDDKAQLIASDSQFGVANNELSSRRESWPQRTSG